MNRIGKKMKRLCFFAVLSILSVFVAETTNPIDNNIFSGHNKIVGSGTSGTTTSLSVDQYIIYDVDITPQWQSASVTTGSYDGGSLPHTYSHAADASLKNRIKPLLNIGDYVMSATSETAISGMATYGTVADIQDGDNGEYRTVDNWAGWGNWCHATGVYAMTKISGTATQASKSRVTACSTYMNTYNYYWGAIGGTFAATSAKVAMLQGTYDSSWLNIIGYPSTGVTTWLSYTGADAVYELYESSPNKAHMTYADVAEPHPHSANYAFGFGVDSTFYGWGVSDAANFNNKVTVNFDSLQIGLSVATSASINFTVSKTITPPAGYILQNVYFNPTNLQLPHGVDMKQNGIVKVSGISSPFTKLSGYYPLDAGSNSIALNFVGTAYSPISTYYAYDVDQLSVYCDSPKLRVIAKKTQTSPVTYDATVNPTSYVNLFSIDNIASLSFEHVGTARTWKFGLPGQTRGLNFQMSLFKPDGGSAINPYTPGDYSSGELILFPYSPSDGSIGVLTTVGTFIGTELVGYTTRNFRAFWTGGTFTTFILASPAPSAKAIGIEGASAELITSSTNPGIVKDERVLIQFTLHPDVISGGNFGLHAIKYWFSTTGFTSSEFAYDTAKGDGVNLATGVVKMYQRLSFTLGGQYKIYIQVSKYDSIAKTNLYQVAVLDFANFLSYDKYTFSNVQDITVSGGQLHWNFDLSSTSPPSRDVFVAAVDESSSAPHTCSFVNSWTNLELKSVTTSHTILFTDTDITISLKFRSISGTRYLKPVRISIMNTEAGVGNSWGTYLKKDLDQVALTVASGADTVIEQSLLTSSHVGNAPLRYGSYKIVFEFKDSATLGGTYNDQYYYSTDPTHRTLATGIILLGLPKYNETLSYQGSLLNWVFFEDSTSSSFTANIVENPDISHMFAVATGSASWITSYVPACKSPQGLARPKIEWKAPITYDGGTYISGLYDMIAISASISDPDGFGDITYIEYMFKNGTYEGTGTGNYFIIPKTKMTPLNTNLDISINLTLHPLVHDQHYTFFLNCKDVAGHNVNKSIIIHPASYAAVISQIDSPSLPTYNYYQYFNFQITIFDQDDDIVKAGALVKAQIAYSNGTVINDFTLVKYSNPSTHVYIFMNATTIQPKLWKGGNFKAGDYLFIIVGKDKYGNPISASKSLKIEIKTPVNDINFDIIPEYNQIYTDMQTITCAARVYDDDFIGTVRGDLSAALGGYAKVWIENTSYGGSFISNEYVAILTYNAGEQYWDCTYNGAGAGFTTSDKQGQYKVHIRIVDAYGNELSNSRRVVINPTYPIITPETPLGGNMNLFSSKYVKIDVVDLGFDLLPNSVKVKMSNESYGGSYSSGWIIMSRIGTSSKFEYTFPYVVGMSEGAYTLNYVASDSRGHISTVSVHIGLVSNAPTIAIQQPDGSGGTPSFGKYQVINIQVLITDPDGDVVQGDVTAILKATNFESTIIILNKGSGLTFYGQYTPSLGIRNETMMLEINVTDSQGHFATDGMGVNLIIYYPRLASPSPQGQIFSYKNIIPVGVRIIDLDNDIVSNEFKIVSNVPGFSYDSGWLPLTWTGFQNYNASFNAAPLVKNGLYQIFYKAIDANGALSLGQTSSFFTIANALPSVVIQTPINNQIFDYNDPIMIQAQVTDTDLDIKSVTYSIYNATYFIANNVSIPWQSGNIWSIIHNHVNQLLIRNGSFVLSVNATDNVKQSTVQNILISIFNHVPRIDSITPPAYSTYNYKDSALFVFTVSDQDADVRNVTITTLENGVPTTFNTTYHSASGTWRYTFNFQNHWINETMDMLVTVKDRYKHVVTTHHYIEIVAYVPRILGISSPHNNAEYTILQPIKIAVLASDQDNDISAVQYWFTNGYIASPVDTLAYNGTHYIDTTSLSAYPADNWQLIVRVVDVKGRQAINDSIHIQVSNYVPVLTVTNPLDNQEIINNFVMQASVVDLDNDVQSVKYQFGYYPVKQMTFDGTKWIGNVVVRDYPYGTYLVTVTANDSVGNTDIKTITLRLFYYEIITIPESGIVYQSNEVVLDYAMQFGSIAITHSNALKALRLRVILPSSYGGDSVTAGGILITPEDNLPVITRGAKKYLPINTLAMNRTVLDFEFTSFALTDTLFVRFYKPMIDSKDEIKLDNTHWAYEYEVKAFRNYTNLYIIDKLIGLFNPGSYEFALEVFTEDGFVAVDASLYQFVVSSSQTEPHFSIYITALAKGDSFIFRIVKYVPVVVAVDNSAWIFGGMAGAIALGFGIFANWNWGSDWPDERKKLYKILLWAVIPAAAFGIPVLLFLLF